MAGIFEESDLEDRDGVRIVAVTGRPANGVVLTILDGALTHLCHLRHGVPNGAELFMRGTGTLRMARNWVDGELMGRELHYDPEGVLEYWVWYTNGIPENAVFERTRFRSASRLVVSLDRGPDGRYYITAFEDEDGREHCGRWTLDQFWRYVYARS